MSELITLDTLPDAVLNATAEAIGYAYDCIRAWEAWSYGTMGPDDFLEIAGQEDRVSEIARAAIAAYLAAGGKPVEASSPVGHATGKFHGDVSGNSFFEVKAHGSLPSRGALLYTHPAPATAQPASLGKLMHNYCARAMGVDAPWYGLSDADHATWNGVAAEMFKHAASLAGDAAPCRHRIVDARNEVVKSGYLCPDCGAVFAAGDHDGTDRAQPAGEAVSDQYAIEPEWQKTAWHLLNAAATLCQQSGTDLEEWVEWLDEESGLLKMLQAYLDKLSGRLVAAQPAQVPDDLIARLRIHSKDKNNTAFARSTMRELLQVLAAPQPKGSDD